jgi:hypothetical protein
LASDRPFRRQAIKLIAQVLLGRGRAHYHAWLPSLKVEDRGEGKPGRVVYRGRKVLDLAGTNLLRDRAGSRIVVIGSGLSAGSAPLEILPERSALLLNGAVSLIANGIADPLAVAIEDERFVWRHFKMMARHVPKTVPLLLSPGAMRALCDIDPDFLETRSVVLIDDIRKPYGHRRRDDAELAGLGHVTLRGTAGFSSQPDRGVFQGGSVVVSALQFAMAAGAGEIGFIGVDIANADAPRFYEDEGAVAFSGIAGAGQRILDHIALAGDIAEEQGVRLINHSNVSALKLIGLGYTPLDASAR